MAHRPLDKGRWRVRSQVQYPYGVSVTYQKKKNCQNSNLFRRRTYFEIAKKEM